MSRVRRHRRFARGGRLHTVALLLALLGSARQPRTSWAAAPPKRPLPDYDGRPPPPTTATETLLWIPRVILFPLYLTSEYVIRRPLGAGITAAERNHVPQVLYDFFTFGPEHKAGFLPTAWLDFGFKPSVGLFLFWDDAFATGNTLRFHIAAWPGDWLAGSITDRVPLGVRQSLILRISGSRRPDYVFFGIGGRSTEPPISRFGQRRLAGFAQYEVRGWRSSRAAATVGAMTAATYRGRFRDDPSVDDLAAIGVLPLPPGFGTVYSYQTNAVTLALDTRSPRPEPGSGVRLQFDGADFNRLDTSIGRGFFRYGAALAGYWDVNGKQRVLSLTGLAAFADAFGGDEIPFPELVTLTSTSAGGGFLPGRILGRSVAAVTAAYRWPIWAFLDASVNLGVGNAFAAHLRDFDPQAFRFSGTIGFESVGSRDSALQFLIGFGTEAFEQGGRIDSFRFLIGNSRGF